MLCPLPQNGIAANNIRNSLFITFCLDYYCYFLPPLLLPPPRRPPLLELLLLLLGLLELFLEFDELLLKLLLELELLFLELL